jgi:hypothetical protein
MAGTQTISIERNIDAANRFLERVAALTPAERERISTESFGSSAHMSAMFSTADEITTVRNRDREGKMSSFLVDVERRVDGLGLSAEVGGLVKAAARAILVHDLPGREQATRQLYSPFESVVPLQTVVD